ncbi:MAG: hypothetical protein L0K86_12415 [Actinomycetia bacterium]|nr:hypothetical protein [Actinomycetes bacterium]
MQTGGTAGNALADLGAHGRPGRWWTPVRVVLAIAALTFSLSLVAKAPCAAGAWWDSPRDAGYACSTDFATDYAMAGLAERVPAWHATGQHVVRPDQTTPDAALSYVAAVTAQALTGGADIDERRTQPVVDLAADHEVRAEAVAFIAVSALVQLVAFLMGVLLLVRSSPAHPYAVTAAAGAPVILFTALLGWDMVLFALVCAAWWAWSSRRASFAGACIGVAGAMTFWPILLMPAFALAAQRVEGAERIGRLLGGAIVAWVCCVLPLVVISGGAYFDPLGTYVDVDIGTGSIWAVLGDLGFAPTGDAMKLILVVGMVLVLMGASIFALKARTAPSAPALALVILIGWFVLTKTYEPQYALALLPFAALAWPNWRDLLIWQTGEIIFVFVASWHAGGYTLDSGDIDRVYPLAIALRIAAQLWLASRVVLAHHNGEERVAGSITFESGRGSMP